MKTNRSVIIIGGGVIGLFCGYYLAKKGYKVTIIEKAKKGEGCSYGNAGMIVPSHFMPLAQPGVISQGLSWLLNPESPFYIKPRLDPKLFQWIWKFYKASDPARVKLAAPILRDLLSVSSSLFGDLARENESDTILHRNGLLMLCQSSKGLKKEIELSRQANEIGVKARVLTPAEVAELEPNMAIKVEGATYYPGDAHLTPHSLMNNLLSIVKDIGVTIKYETEVTAINYTKNDINSIETTSGVISGNEYLIAAGAWSAWLAEKLSVNLPMQAGKGYSLMLYPTLSTPIPTPKICAICSEAKITMTPMEDGIRFAGTMEISGLKENINHRRVDGIKKAVTRYFPDIKQVDLKQVPIWAGLRPCSADGLPFVGRINAFQNLSVATGHGMLGISLGPITGKMIVQTLENDINFRVPELIDPNRFI